MKGNEMEWVEGGDSDVNRQAEKELSTLLRGTVEFRKEVLFASNLFGARCCVRWMIWRPGGRSIRATRRFGHEMT